MVTFHRPALPEVSQDHLPAETSIHLVRASNSVLEVNESFGDDILWHIAVGDRKPPLVGPRDFVSDQYSPSASYIQILFVNSVRVNRCTSTNLQLTKGTLEELCTRFGISWDFPDAVLNPSIWSKQSGGSFRRYNAEEEVEAIDGFYSYFNEWDLGPLHVWFSYDVRSRSATYFLVDCPESVKEKIVASACARCNCTLYRPFQIDLLIAEQCADWREKFIEKHYKQIFEWHERNGSMDMDPPLRRDINTVGNVQNLHELSRTWNMLFEDLADLEERLNFLIETAGKLDEAGIRQAKSAIESFQFLRARNHLRQRWVSSFGQRTKLIINFIFSETNLGIATITTRIAWMGMLFLPGTFIATIFSMAFFNYGVDNNGREYFQVSKLVWVFPAIAIPVTILIFAIYLFYHYWQRGRRRRISLARLQSQESPDADIEMGGLLPSLSEDQESPVLRANDHLRQPNGILSHYTPQSIPALLHPSPTAKATVSGASSPVQI